jgi:hypothetical protein
MKNSTWVLLFAGWAMWLAGILVLFFAQRLGVNSSSGLIQQVLLVSACTGLVGLGGLCQYRFTVVATRAPAKVLRRIRTIIAVALALLGLVCLGVCFMAFTLWVDGKGFSLIKENLATILILTVSILTPFTSAMIVEHSLDKKGPPLPIRPPDQ